MTFDGMAGDSDYKKGDLPGTGMKLFRSLLLVFMITLLLACSDSAEEQKNFEQSLASATAYREQGQLEAAVIELKNALLHKPDSLEARSQLGHLYLSLGNAASADKEFRHVQEGRGDPASYLLGLGDALLRLNAWQDVLDRVRPDSALPIKSRARIYAQRGSAYIGLKEIDAARQAFAKALELDTNCVPAWLGKAALAMDEGYHASARQLISQAREQAKDGEDAAEAWRMTAELARLDGNNASAEQAFSKAIEYTAFKPALQSSRALLRIEMSDYAGAREDLGMVSEKLPSHPAVLYGYGVLAVREGRFREAIDYLGRLKQLAPAHTQGLFYLGVANYAEGNLEDAASYLEQAVAQLRGSITAVMLLAEVRYRMGDYREAARLLEPQIASQPDNPALQSLLGSVYIAIGQTKQGSELLGSVVAKQPEKLSDRLKLGLSLIRLGDNNAGVRELEQVSADLPESDNARVALLVGYVQVGNYKAARAIANELLVAAPDQAAPWNYIGMVEFAAGQRVAAREAFEKALTISPDTASVGFNLARLEQADGNVARAQALYEQILEKHPDHMRVLMALMSLQAGIGNQDYAQRLAERAIKSHPTELAPRLWLARKYLAEGEPKKSLELFQQIEPHYRDDRGFQAVLGEAQLLAGETLAGMNTFKSLSELEPKDVDIQYMYARACAIHGGYLELGEALMKAMTLRPDHPAIPMLVQRLIALSQSPDSIDKMLWRLSTAAPDSQFMIKTRGDFALQHGWSRKAVSIFEEARKRYPDQYQWWGQLAYAHALEGNTAQALDILRLWLDLHPKEVQALLLEGKVLLADGNVEQARNKFSYVLELDPDNIQALNNLAWLLREADISKARVYAERAVELEPNAITRDTLGVILLTLGENEPAEELLQQAFREQPESAEIRYHLAKVLAKLKRDNEARSLLREVLRDETPKFDEREQAETLLQQLGG